MGIESESGSGFLPGCVTVAFAFEVEPVPQPRSRAGKKFGSERLTVYVPRDHPVHAYRLEIGARAKLILGSRIFAPADVAVRTRTTFILPRPTSLSNQITGRTPAFTKPSPDLDNLLKSLWDAMKGVIWVDDVQVWYSEEMKYYAGVGEEPGVELQVSRASPEAVVPHLRALRISRKKPD